MPSKVIFSQDDVSSETRHFGPKQEGVLYHYTNHDSLYGIVESGKLRASHVYYMNDANEIKFAIDRFVTLAEARAKDTSDNSSRALLMQIRSWIQNMRNQPHFLFAFSLSEVGNLLSQWRAYTKHGTGVSIGFCHSDLERYAAERGINLVKCVYDKQEQDEILGEVLREILVNPPVQPRGSIGQEYHPHLTTFTAKLLGAFVKIKDPAFQEEREWRLVSKWYERYTDDDVKYRSGFTTLIPYVEFDLEGLRPDGKLFEKIYVGPSPNFDLAFPAIEAYLSKNKACSITINSQQPFREV